MSRETCEHLVPIALRCDHCEAAKAIDPYAAVGNQQVLHMQLSVMRKTIDALKATQGHDEALLRQALEALEDDCLVQVGPHAWERRSDLAIAALRERLGETKC